jgi:hypothetical protein
LTAGQAEFASEVNQAIDRGIQRILAWQSADGSFGGATHATGYPLGQSALAVYALLKSGLPADDPAVERALRFLESQPTDKVYSVALWILALDALRAPERSAEIRTHAAWLEQVFDPQARLWGYPGGVPELSNTQFAALGLAAAARHGYTARPKLWADMLAGALALQNKDGGFGYKPNDRPESQGSMTTAGITTLELACAALAEERSQDRALRDGRAGLERAWAWLERHFTATGNPAFDNGLLMDRQGITADRLYMFHYYYLWGLERVAAVGGRRVVGGRDWYSEGALQLLLDEELEGGFGHLDTTAFALLFLRRATYSGLAGVEAARSRPAAEVWSYTSEVPGLGWEQPGFDAQGWARGAGSFGNWLSPYRQDRTEWTGADIWLRRDFRLQGDPAELRLFAVHDDGLEVYLNGVLAAEEPLWSPTPHELALRPEARSALRPGENLIAVHGHDIGGARTLDVRFADQGGLAARLERTLAPAEPAWLTPPEASVPFLRRWLVLGPLADEDHGLFSTDVAGEPELVPEAGKRTRGLLWREVRALAAELDLSQAKAKGSFTLAYTELAASEETDAILWLGAGDGLSAWVDGELRLSHHAHGAAAPDALALPLHLKGVQRLFLRVENAAGPSALYARLAGPTGEPLANVRPQLDSTPLDRAAAARAAPEFFPLAELATLLPLATRASIAFTSPEEAELVSVAGATPGFPRWVGGKPARDAAAGEPRPSANAAGLLALQAAGGAPTRLLWRAEVPSPGASLRLVAFPDTRAPLPGPRATWSVWVDGELRPLGTRAFSPQGSPKSAAWDLDVSAYQGRELLFVLELPAGVLFLDELALVRAR